MRKSLVRFFRGFLSGAFVGAACLIVGILGWTIAMIIGVEKDDSTYGMTLLPLYVLSFALGGGVTMMFRADTTLSVKSSAVWLFALIIVYTGAFLIASVGMLQAPIDPRWGIFSGLVLFGLLTVAIVISVAQRRTKSAAANATFDRDQVRAN